MVAGALVGNIAERLPHADISQPRRARRVRVAGYESDAEGLLENVDGRYRITAVTVRPKVTLNSDTDIETARSLMGKVEEQCFISNSITSKIDLQPEFRVV